MRKVSRSHRMIADSLVPSLLAKMKVLLILAQNSWKTEVKLFPLCAIAHGNYS